MPSQLPAPASQRHLEIAHHLVRLRRSIRRGSLVRQYFNPSTSQVLLQNLSIDRSSAIQSFSSIDVSAHSMEPMDHYWRFRVNFAESRVLLFVGAMIDLILKTDFTQYMKFNSVYANFICDGDGSLANVPNSRRAIFKDGSWSSLEKNQLMRILHSVSFTESATRLLRLSPLIVSSSSWSSSVNSLSKVLISPLFTVSNRSRSENSSSKVLDYPPSVAFNRSPWSRSMESVGESMSTVLIKKNRSTWSRSINLRCYQVSKYGIQIQVLSLELDGSFGELVMFWRLFRFDCKSLMFLDSQSVGTSYKQSAVDLDFELRLAFFYLSLFLKSELGYEVNDVLWPQFKEMFIYTLLSQQIGGNVTGVVTASQP